MLSLQLFSKVVPHTSMQYRILLLSHAYEHFRYMSICTYLRNYTVNLNLEGSNPTLSILNTHSDPSMRRTDWISLTEPVLPQSFPLHSKEIIIPADFLFESIWYEGCKRGKAKQYSNDRQINMECWINMPMIQPTGLVLTYLVQSQCLIWWYLLQ